MSGGGGVSESDIARAVRAVGDGLAAVVTEKGFPTTVREACGVAVAGVSASDAAASKREEPAAHRGIHQARRRRLGARRDVPHRPRRAHVPPRRALAKVLCSTPVHAGLSVFALLGPGRETLADGWRALRRGGRT